MSRVPTLRPPTHDEKREEAVRIEDEFRDASKHRKGMGAAPSKATGRKMLKAALKEEQEHAEHEYAAGDRVKMRQQILALRLFPNLFNREFLLKAQGPN